MAITPVLTDGVVTLRAHVDADVEDLLLTGSDAESARWTTVPVPYGRHHAEHWVHEEVPAGWRDGTAFRWAIEAVEAGRPRFAGNLDIRTGPPPDLGFAAAPWARGRGLVTRAARLATRWAFDTCGLPIVHWSSIAGHLASWRVAHACGFTFHGERPLSVAHRGVLHDGWYASLRPGDEQSPRTTWWPVPVLDGERVRLRAHTEADLPRIAEACSDERSRHWLAGLPHPYTVQTAREFVRSRRLGESLGQSVTWAVAARDDDRLLANVGVFGLDDALNPTGGEIGYWAHPDARGRGIVGEAVDLAVAHAFTPVPDGGLGRHRLQIGAAWSNTASRHVAERAGFTLAARYRLDGVIGHGESRRLDDGAWYERLVDDPAAVTTRRG
ncbi:GNAT family N-acetyltransferase [Pseudonocardia xinjiangensis]|uniref:GNAT family N-acetyltransferase n=1 Tax=Pseudonocardia xinjiangensis TaxID=75289 RepID=A0ABX1RTA1_9PSEU|nr:GNAT family N-acetyltransferase [Pseudonocardia xinjiangensis]NMH82463.1 GNAT family N-acetyltransferase [Pseudonocardia xinjiangensis]